MMGLGNAWLTAAAWMKRSINFRRRSTSLPVIPKYETNLILALTKKGRTDEAIAHLQTFLEELSQ